MPSLFRESLGEYNRDQLITVHSVLEVLWKLKPEEVGSLRTMIRPYLAFRREVDEYYNLYFKPTCRSRCFDTRLSACCGFESIITFFADHVISLLESTREQRDLLLSFLNRPNITQRCVYLGPQGCVWKVPPISCAMFLCAPSKETVFEVHPEAESLWTDHQQAEKRFTWPDRPVLFDTLERFFMERGCDTPHLLFHRSPGLLRAKAMAGLV